MERSTAKLANNFLIHGLIAEYPQAPSLSPAGIPQSRDRRFFFMDLTLRRAKGFVQNKLRELPWLGALRWSYK